jgi:hypothetical protein
MSTTIAAHAATLSGLFPVWIILGVVVLGAACCGLLYRQSGRALERRHPARQSATYIARHAGSGATQFSQRMTR